MTTLFALLGMYFWAWIVYTTAWVKKLDYVNEFKKSSLYFLGATIPVLLLFHKNIASIIKNISYPALGVFLLFFISLYFFYQWARKKFKPG